MAEELTACRKCKWFRRASSVSQGPDHCYYGVALRRTFDCVSGKYRLHLPGGNRCDRINTNGHCPIFTRKRGFLHRSYTFVKGCCDG